MHRSGVRRSSPRAAFVAVAAGLSLLAAGCGGGSTPPAVADLGTTTASTSSQDTQGSSTSGSGSKLSGARAFSACMRTNGVPNFPDPSSGGGISITSKSGLNPDSPQFRSAQTKCQKLLPNGGQPTPAQREKMQSQALAYSACMRAHGVPKFPDPQFSGNGVRLSINARSGIDPQSPQFQAAQQACAHVLPGLKSRVAVPGSPAGPKTAQSGGTTGP